MSNKLIKEKLIKEKVQLMDFPISVRVKPTAHKQFCWLCRNKIEKGSQQIMLTNGMWLTYVGADKRRVCTAVHDNVRSGKAVHDNDSGNMNLYSRKIYMHTNCFSCTLKRLLAKMNIPLMPNCDGCDDKFNCYTGNSDIVETSCERPSYKPSRACTKQLEDCGYHR